MKNKCFWLIAGLAAACMMFGACDSGSITNVPLDPPLTGDVTITVDDEDGHILVGGELSADTEGLGGSGTIYYQWKRADAEEGEYTNIPGADEAVYELVSDDSGKYIVVTVTRAGYSGSVTSEAVGEVKDERPALAGSVSISGTATVGQTLEAITASVTGVTTTGTFSYQWKRADTTGGDKTDIDGATAVSYLLVPADAAQFISVEVKHTKYSGSQTSAETAAVALPAISGDVTISGSPIVGQTLEADISGVENTYNGIFSYQWKADNADITGAANKTYTVAVADNGKKITVTVTNTAYEGSQTSDETAAVTLPAIGGQVTISGTAVVGEQLTAVTSQVTNTLNGAFSFKWKNTGADISGATSGTYTLAAADVGKAITVEVSNNAYTGTLTGTLTGTVTFPPITAGSVSISGTAQRGQTLTAVVSNLTGGINSYQWKSAATANDTATNIAGATSGTYVPVTADATKFITVTVTNTVYDGSLTSTAVGPVTLPALSGNGNVAITGNAVVGQELTAGVTGITGGTTAYQWKADGADIPGATSGTYTLVPGDAGKAITVTITNSEFSGSVTSTATASVTLPAITGGQVSITGTAEVGQTLTANVTGLTGGTNSYQWKSAASSSAAGTNIVGATSSSYQPVAGDAGKYITVEVTNTAYSGSIISTATAAVVAATLPEITGSVSITGTATVGQQLTANVTGVSGGTTTYQWKRGATAVAAATGTNIGTNSDTYTLVSADASNFITVIVTNTQYSGGLTATAVGSVNTPISGSVSITGTTTVGQVLTASVTGVTGGTNSYQWKSAATSGGAATNIGTGSTYVLTSAEATKYITVEVTNTLYGGSLASPAVGPINSPPTSDPELSLVSSLGTTNLQLHYAFSQVSGNTSRIEDMTGNGRYGTISGSGITVGTEYGAGFVKTGTATSNGGYISINNGNTLMSSLTGNYTIATYVNIDTVTDIGANGNFIWCFANTTNAGATAGNYMFFGAGRSRHAITTSGYNNEQTVNVNNTQMEKGVWKHVMYTQNGSTGTLYMDGVQVATATTVSLKLSALSATNNWLFRPCFTSDAYLANTKLYDFRIYNAAMTVNTTVRDGIQNTLAAFRVNAFYDSLNLSNLNSVTSDLTLPTTGGGGVTVAWQSSNPAVIAVPTGIVTRPSYGARPATVYLTATISSTVGSVTATRKKVFTATVSPWHADIPTIVQTDADALTIDVLPNYYRPLAYGGVNDRVAVLPSKGANGTTVSWASNRPEYVINSGKLALPEASTTEAQLTLTATVSLSGVSRTKTFSGTAFNALPENQAYTAYLWAYFLNNASGQQVCYAISDNARHWKALNGNNPVLSNFSSTGTVRDPFILRGEDGWFYMVNTDMTAASGWDSNRGIVLSKSPDLINWTHSSINIATKYSQTYHAVATTTRLGTGLRSAWAPQVFYDPSVKKYMVYFSIATSVGNNDNSVVYWFYANSDFTDLEGQPAQLLYVGNGSNQATVSSPSPGMAVIDCDIVWWRGDYYLFYKTEGWRNGTNVASFDHNIVKSKNSTTGKITGPYYGYNHSYKASATQLDNSSTNIEGSSTFRLINTDTWYLIYDVYSASPRTRYDFNVSRNAATPLDAFDAISDNSPLTSTANANRISRDFNPMHGSVIPITAKEKAALMEKWGN